VRKETYIFVNLNPTTYWSLLSHCDALVGNSSSGIMEAASFALPVVNVGMRQQGRERARNIIDVAPEKKAILRGIECALSAQFRSSLDGMVNPYGDGTAATAIAKVLAEVDINGLLIKQPAPLPDEI
jgi:UDP-N-acetylglucosamine 2-epimerase